MKRSVIAAGQRVVRQGGASRDATGRPIFRHTRQARLTPGASSPASAEGLERRTYFAVGTDAQGWTVVTPSSDTRIVYVSTSGNDANAGLTTAAPVATVARARTLVRTGYPDQILLRRGDTFFNSSISNWNLSGRNANEPFVLGAYTDPAVPSAQRPKVATGITNGFQAAGTANANVYIMGIAFEANTRNFREPPTNGTFTTDFRTETEGATNGVRVLGPFTNLLIEDCSFQYYKSNLTIQTTTSNGVERVVSDVRLRRNVIADAYVPNVDSSGVFFDAAVGVYAEGVRGLTMDGNLLSHNGWADDNALGAVQNIYSHNAYINSLVTDFTFINNISADAAATGIQARAGGIIKDNLFLRNPIAMTYGYLNGAGVVKPGGASGEVSGNVVVGTSRILDSSRGYGIELGHLRPISQGGGTVVRNNVFANDAPTNTQFAIKLEIGRIDNPDSTPDVGINDLRLESNVVYSWARGLYLHNGYNNPGSSTNRVLKGLTVTGNDFQRLFSSAGSMIEHANPYVASAEAWSNNRYDGTAADSGGSRWFSVNGSQLTYAQWKATYEPTADRATGLFPDPGRSPAGYNATLGGAATADAFLAEAARQSRLYWRPKYAAPAVDAYVRAGYAGGRVDTAAPTASADAENIAVGGAGAQTFAVTYADDNQLGLASLGTGDVRVTGPNNYSAVASLVSSVGNLEGTLRTATYTVPAPGGAWSAAGNGIYQLAVQANEVLDASGKAAAAAQIGTFAVTIDPAVPSAVATAPVVVTDTAPATVAVAYSGAISPGLATVVTPLNPGFETPNVGANTPDAFAVAPAGGDWTFAGGAGISGNGSALTAGNAPAPQGAQAAFLPGSGSLTQVVDGWQAGTFQLSFQAAQRANVPAAQNFQVFVDDRLIGNFNPTAGAAYQPFSTTPFEVTAGTHTLRFAGLNSAGGDNTAFIDDVRITGTTAPTQQTISAATIDAADVRLTGAGGFSAAAVAGFTSPDTTDATQKTAVYTFAAPAGGWASLGVSSMNVNVVAGQVLTTSAAAVPAAKIGTVGLSISPPEALVAAADAAPGSAADHFFAVTYTDNAPGTALAGSLDASDLRVLGPNAFNRAATFVSASGVGTAASPLVATYRVAPPAGGWIATANGTYGIVAQPNQVVDADANALPAGTIGQFRVAVDASPPVASIIDVASVTAPSTTGRTITVNYYDASGIDAATLDNADIRLTGPGGYDVAATRGTITTSGKGRSVLYTAPAPAGGWKSRNNGSVNVVLQPGQVADVGGVTSTSALTIGTFSVALETVAPTVALTPVTPNPRNAAVSSVAFKFSESVAGVDLTDLALTRDGGAVALTGATVSTADNVNFTLAGLSAIGTNAGTYVLIFKPGGVEDAAGNVLTAGSSTNWVVDLTPPQAAGSATGVTVAGGASQITVAYSDAVGVNALTIDSADLLVTGPNGYSATAVLQSVTGGGTGRTAVYTAAPAGGWQAAQNGTYAVALRAAQVTDAAGNAAAAATLATFVVNVPQPPVLTSVVVNDGAAQRSRVTSLTVTFSTPVLLSAGAIALAGRDGAGAGTVTTITPSTGAAQSFTLTFGGTPVVGGSLADGVYDLTILASAVRTPAGTAMAADQAFKFHRLYGDDDGDGDLDAADLFQLRRTVNRSSGDALFKPQFDYDASGVIDAADLFQIRRRARVEFKGY